MKTIDILYAIISTGIIIACCCSLIIGWVPIFGRTWIWTLFLSIISLLCYSKGLKLKFVFPLLIYGFILYLNMLTGDEKFDFVFSTMEFFSFIGASYAFYIFSQNAFTRARKNLLIIYLFVVILTFIGTLSVYMVEPEVLRMIQEGLNEGDSTLYSFYAKFGVESYAMGHALPCFIPIIIYGIKNFDSSLYKFFLLILLFIIVVLIYMSTATTALLLSIILIGISFVWNNNKNSKNIKTLILIVFCLIIFLSNRDILGLFLNSINWDSNSTYGGKMDDLQEYVSYGSAGRQTEGRFNLYEQSLDLFFSSPIIGSNDSKIGGHSIFLDRMAMLGLIGFIPLFLYLYNYIKYVLRKLSKNIRPYCMLGFVFFIIMGFLKNIYGFEYVLIILLIMPITCLFVDEIIKKSN